MDGEGGGTLILIEMPIIPSHTMPLAMKQGQELQRERERADYKLAAICSN